MPLDIGHIDPRSLRSRVSLSAVAAAIGVVFDPSGDAYCPFHDDRRPSLKLYVDDNDVERWVCHPCGLSDDVYGLVRRIEGLSFPEAIDRVEQLSDSAPAQARAPRVEFDREACGAIVSDALARAEQNRGWLCVAAGLLHEHTPQDEREHADRVLRGLAWGVDHAGNIVMAHYDSAGTLTGAKIRALDGYKWAFPGSTFESLYGSWLPRQYRDVLICEGEGDFAFAKLQDPPVDVYAMPRGAGPGKFHEGWKQLEADRYFLALDGDAAGVTSTAEWLLALPDSEVRVCPVPLGHDLKSARPDIVAMLNASVRPRRPSVDLVVNHDRFERGDRALTSWYCVPTAKFEPVDEDGGTPGLEITVYADGRDWQDSITVADLHNSASFSRWASARSLDSLAGDHDVKEVRSFLLAQGSVLPTVLQTARVGAHRAPDRYRVGRSSVVFPGGSVGILPWRYTGGKDAAAHVHLAESGVPDWRWVEQLLALNEQSVTHPLVAWVAASARRADMTHFPLLFLGGSSGSGKTTTARLACMAVGSSLGISLASSTQFTLIRALSSSTSLPVFVDEWSLQSRQDAREALQSVIPVIYEGGVTPRGRADLSVVEYRLTSPVILAGEDSFNLDREADRMVALRLRVAEQNYDTLRALANAPLHLLARSYQEWVVGGSELPGVPPVGDDRPGYNRKVLEMGWATLRAYLEAMGERADVPVLPDLDLSGLDHGEDDAPRENEYEVYLREAASFRDGDGIPLVWEASDGSGVWARFRPLASPRNMSAVDVELPGRARSMEQYFSDRYEVVNTRAEYLGKLVNAALIRGFKL